MYLKKNLNKIVSTILCFSFLLAFQTPSFPAAADIKNINSQDNQGTWWNYWNGDSKNFANDAAKIMVAQLAVQVAWKGLEKFWDGLIWAGQEACSTTEWCGEERFKGFKPLDQALESLERIQKGTSARKIYGQPDAKSQFVPIMLRSLEKIEEAKNGVIGRDKRGNAIYIVGPPGTGKTELVKATAEDILKYPEKTFLVVDPSMINDKSSLDDQLFKTLYQEENIQKAKVGTDTNIYDARGRSKILSALQDYDGEVIIFIDDYEKMKEKSSPNARTANKYPVCDEKFCEIVEGPEQDRTADETLKQIAENGGYWIGKTWIPCDKAIIFIATNENLEDLENNFGFGGEKGGGVQRLGGSNNIIQFKSLDFETCRRIVINVISKLREKFTDPLGNYKFTSFLVREETIDELAHLIESDKKVQGRLKYPMETAISAVFADCISGDGGRGVFELIYKRKDASNPLHPSNFQRRQIIGKTCLDLQKVNADEKRVDNFSDKCSCCTCKTFIIPFENFYERLDDFKKKLPLDSKQETLDEINRLLKREVKQQRFLNNNCLVITVNTEVKHQNYVTLKFAKKETFGTFSNWKLKSMFSAVL